MIGALVMRAGGRLGWRALNRGDLGYFDRWVADDVVADVQGRPPFGGHFIGKTAWFEQNQAWIDQLEWYRFRVVHQALAKPFALGLTNTVYTEYVFSARRPDGRTVRTRGIDVSVMERGKLVAQTTYGFDADGVSDFFAPRPVVEETVLEEAIPVEVIAPAEGEPELESVDVSTRQPVAAV